MNRKTKAAFKWIASAAIAMGLMVQPALAGEKYHYKKHHYSSAHQHNPYCRHSNRQGFNYNNYYHKPKRHYTKRHYYNNNRDHDYGPRVKHYRHDFRGRHGAHSGFRYRERGGTYIKLRF